MMEYLKRHNTFVAVMLIAGVGFAVCASNLHVPLFWDDIDWIVENPLVHTISLEHISAYFTENVLAGVGQVSNYYRPLLLFTFAVNYVVSGTSPITYHLVSNLLHIANAVFVFLLLQKLFRKYWLSVSVALLFDLHPLQTEAVTYISGRGDPLHVFFMLVALLVHLRNRERSHSVAARYLMPILLFVGALLSRETAIIFPFLVVLVEMVSDPSVLFLRPFTRALCRALPYFIIAILYGILRLTVLNFADTLNFFASPNAYSEHLYVRFFTFFAVLVRYSGLIFWPAHLHMERSVTIYDSLLAPAVIIPMICLIGIGLLLVHLYRRVKTNTLDVVLFRIVVFSVGWFFVCLGPTSGVTPINAQMYEHWLYLALVGPLTLSFYIVGGWFIQRSNRRKVGAFLFVVLLAVTSALTIQRNRVWGDTESFFLDILRYEPQSIRIRNNLGTLYQNRGDLAKAEAMYRVIAEQATTFAQPAYNLGTVLQLRGDIVGAISQYQRAISIEPRFPYPYQKLAIIYVERGNLSEAEKNLLILKSLTPHDPEVYLNLGKLYLYLKRNQDAKSILVAGLAESGDDPTTFSAIQDLLKRL